MPFFSNLVEKTRQRLNVGDKSFKPTPNVRNPCMLEEAQEFSRHMQTYKTLLSQYGKHMEGFLTTLPLVCGTNLPRVWESVEGTNMSEPVHPEVTSGHPLRTGGDNDEVLMADAAEIMRRRVEAIIKPMDRWLDSLAVVKQRMSRVEQLRVQVDARRRRVHRRWLRALSHMSKGQAAALKAQASETLGRRPKRALAAAPAGAPIPEEEEEEEEEGGAFSTMRAAVASPGEDMTSGRRASIPRGIESDIGDEEDLDRQREREDYAREAITQQRQLEAVSESYEEQERLVFEQLSGLVRDAAYFKSYVAASFLVIKDTLQATLAALGPCKRPLPGFSEREPTEGTALYGRVAPINDLVEALPPVVKEGGRQLPPGVRSPAGMAPEEIHASRMTAQPLQVAADDVSGAAARYANVPPVPKTPSRARSQIGGPTEPATPLFADAPASYQNHSTGDHGVSTPYEESSGYGYGTPTWVPPGEGESAGGESATRTFPALQTLQT